MASSEFVDKVKMRERHDMSVSDFFEERCTRVRRVKRKKGEADKIRQEEESKGTMDKKNGQNEEGERIIAAKGLPHDQVPLPGKDFSSEALENLEHVI